MSKYIDLNCDMGESYYDKIVGNDSKIMPYITSCNIACGFHGGDPLTIGKTIRIGEKKNTSKSKRIRINYTLPRLCNKRNY